MLVNTRSLWAAALVALCSACGGDAETVSQTAALYETLVERQSAEVGGGTPARLRFGAAQNIELDVPGEVAPTRVGVQVALVTGTVRRGQHPVNDAGLLVEPAGLRFAVPVRVRQPVPPPAPGKTYVAVVIPDGETAFVARTPGRRVAPADDSLGGLEIWEGDGDGSGLWGFALVDERD